MADNTVTIPDTPAGRRFVVWLTAFDSGNPNTIRQFVATNWAPPPNGTLPLEGITRHQFGFYQSTQGFDAREVVASSPEKLTVAVQNRRTGNWTLIRMTVSPDAEHKIMGFGFSNTEAPADLLPPNKLTDGEIRERIDGLISKLVAADQFSGVIVVARDGKPVYQRACGLANRTWNVPNRIDTRFNIASIGKMFTAVAIAQLVEQGKLAYGDTLDKVLPDYPNKEIAQKVTVQHLLTHTSGIAEGHAASGGENQGFPTLKSYPTTAANDTLKFEPGSKLEYDNYGYLLLGAIVEKVSGQDYYTYIREHIYKPAGMADSDSYELDTDPPNLATGFMDAPGGTRRSNIFRLPLKGLPYGLGYATAGDMVRFAEALRAHKLLSAASLETVWTGRMDYTEAGSQYGYGCIVKPYNGTRIIGHGGGWVGITDKFDMYPDLGYTVVILTNIDSDPNAIAFRLREWLTQGRN